MKERDEPGIAAKFAWSGVISLAAIGLVVGVSTLLPHPAAAPPVPPPPAPAPRQPSPLDATYLIDGRPVALAGGETSWSDAPDGSTVTRVRVFSVAARGDLDGDGAPDAAILLTKDAGGSGTFFYVAAALSRGATYQGTNAVLLGDRVAPDTTQIENGTIVTNYATREAGEPMTAQASQGKSMYLRYQAGVLAQIPNP